MKGYEIKTIAGDCNFGTFYGANQTEALGALARREGFASFSEAVEKGDWERDALRVTEVVDESV